MIKFVVYGEPVAQGRPRASRVAGHVRMYDPAKSRSYKDYVRLVAAEQSPEKLLEGPLVVLLKVFKPIPRSFSKKKAEQAEGCIVRPVTKPDVDNYVKILCDALNGVIWRDDSQVVELNVGKYYGNKPRIEVEIHDA